MSLILTIINQAKPGQEISKAFEQEGTIGRSSKNSWVLIDPNRFISSQHAKVHLEDNNYYITDTSTNGLFINKSSQPLGKNNSAILKQGDVLTIGEYEISVSIQLPQQAVNPNISPFDVTPAAAPGKSESPFEPLAPTPQFEAHPSKPVSADIQPDEQVDPLAMFGKQSRTPEVPEPQAPRSGLDDLFNPQSGNTPAPSGSGLASNHAPPLQQHFQPPQMIPEDWDFSEPAEQQAKAATPEQIPPLDFVSTDQPQPAAPQPDQARPQAVQPPPAAVSESIVLKSLLEGLHMESLQLSAEEIPDFSHTVGEVTRAAVEGMLTALRARSSIKSEFRMSMTTIQAKENNPLKFSATIDDALINMFHNPSSSYLAPTQAMVEGFNDLEAHMIAVMAGMQVALNAVLRRFDPINLERDFEQRQGGISILPGGKKAKHWDAYLQHYKDIIASAEDDFQTFFGDEFTRAYEEQARKLKLARGNPS